MPPDKEAALGKLWLIRWHSRGGGELVRKKLHKETAVLPHATPWWQGPNDFLEDFPQLKCLDRTLFMSISKGREWRKRGKGTEKKCGGIKNQKSFPKEDSKGKELFQLKRS